MSKENKNQDISVLMLGGAGAMGKVAVETIRNFKSVNRIVVADRDENRAQKVAYDMGKKVEARAVDALDYKALVSTMREFDYIISTLGPFYKFGTHVLNAAIEAKIDYIDICDDWEPTLEILELDDMAKKSGIRALVGAGASPGISNMLALKAINSMDSVETLYTGWGAKTRNDENDKPGDSDGAAAAVEHWVHQFTGTIRVQENGTELDQPPLVRHILPHPTGGHCGVYSLGHPEPVTFPKYFPHIQNSYNVMDMPDFVISVLRSIQRRVDKGEIDIKEAAVYLENLTSGGQGTIRFPDILRYGFHTTREILRKKKYMPDLHATAIGKKNGSTQITSTWMNGRIEGGMGPMTCVPTAVFLSMFIDGKINRKGVFAPEGAVDPDEFFARLAPYITKDNPNLPLILTAEM